MNTITRMMSHYGGRGNSIGSAIFTVGVIVLIVALVLYIVKEVQKNKPSKWEETLKMQFAQGELSEEEYFARRRVLLGETSVEATETLEVEAVEVETVAVEETNNEQA
ncbi:MAG: hypothetical protein ACRCZJ_08375 [Erysipelotrichaceae bacterium]